MIGRRQWVRFAIMVVASWVAIAAVFLALLFVWGAESARFQEALRGLLSIAIVWVPVIIAVGLLDLVKERRKLRSRESEGNSD